VKHTLANLKDFLKYLNDKGIIVFEELQNNKKELENLVKDLLKLDLEKFSAANQLSKDQLAKQQYSQSAVTSPTYERKLIDDHKFVL
jgi:hypothetical protein